MTTKRMGAPPRIPARTDNQIRNRVIGLREQLGYTNAELARRLGGVSEGTIRNWLAGRCVPSSAAMTLIEQMEKKAKKRKNEDV